MTEKRETPDQFAVAAYGRKISEQVAAEMSAQGLPLISKDTAEIEAAIIRTITGVIVRRQSALSRSGKGK